MADLSDLEQQVRERALQLVRTAGNDVGGQTVLSSPVDTGLMRSRHGVSAPVANGNVASCELSADTFYAEWVAYGTRPHVIAPRNAALLRFQAGGRIRYARIVNHPGTRPRPEWWSTETIQERWTAALERAAS